MFADDCSNCSSEQKDERLRPNTPCSRRSRPSAHALQRCSSVHILSPPIGSDYAIGGSMRRLKPHSGQPLAFLPFCRVVLRKSGQLRAFRDGSFEANLLEAREQAATVRSSPFICKNEGATSNRRREICSAFGPSLSSLSFHRQLIQVGILSPCCPQLCCTALCRFCST